MPTPLFKRRERVDPLDPRLFPYTEPVIPTELGPPGSETRVLMEHIAEDAAWYEACNLRPPKIFSTAKYDSRTPLAAPNYTFVGHSASRPNVFEARPSYVVWRNGVTERVTKDSIRSYRTAAEAYWCARFKAQAAMHHYMEMRSLAREMGFRASARFTSPHPAFCRLEKEPGRLATREEVLAIEAAYIKKVESDAQLAEILAGLNAILGDIPT